MTFPIIPSSEIMKGIINNDGKLSKYSWSLLTVGNSFLIPSNEKVRISSVQSMASRMGKKYGMKLKVIDHGDKGIEVGCVGMREEFFNKIEKTQPIQNANANFAFEPFKPFKNNESE